MEIGEIANRIYFGGMFVLTISFIAILIIAYPTLKKTHRKSRR